MNIRARKIDILLVSIVIGLCFKIMAWLLYNFFVGITALSDVYFLIAIALTFWLCEACLVYFTMKISSEAQQKTMEARH